MKASRVTVSSFGTIIGIAGIEHGVGEILQENKAQKKIREIEGSITPQL